jgi:acetyl esterase/lipase
LNSNSSFPARALLTSVNHLDQLDTYSAGLNPIYLPEVRGGGESGRLPVIVHLHGGGFCISHPSWLMYHHFYSRVACTMPAAVVSVELPLAPKRRLPAHIDTGVAALCRLRSIALSEDAEALDDPVSGDQAPPRDGRRVQGVPRRGQLRR